MSDPATLVTLASAGTAAIAVSAAAGLRGWQDWLEVRRIEIDSSRGGSRRSGIADLDELRRRVRRLEAIASGRDS